MFCTLLVPDLLPPGPRDAQHPAPRAPRLAALLARGTVATMPAGGMEAWLCAQFGVARAEPVDGARPVGQRRRVKLFQYGFNPLPTFRSHNL